MKIRSKTKKIICFIVCMLLFLGLCLSFVFMNISSSSAYLFLIFLIVLFLGAYFVNRYIMNSDTLPVLKFKDDILKIVSFDAKVKTVFRIYYEDIITAMINSKGCLVVIFKSGGKSNCICIKNGVAKEKITHSYVSPPIPPDSELANYIVDNKFYEITLSKRYYKKYTKVLKKKKWDF